MPSGRLLPEKIRSNAVKIARFSANPAEIYGMSTLTIEKKDSLLFEKKQKLFRNTSHYGLA